MSFDNARHNVERTSHVPPPSDNAKRRSVTDTPRMPQEIEDPAYLQSSSSECERPFARTADLPLAANPHASAHISYPRHAFSASSPLNFEDFEAIEVPIPTPPDSSRASSLHRAHEEAGPEDPGNRLLGERTTLVCRVWLKRSRTQHAEAEA